MTQGSGITHMFKTQKLWLILEPQQPKQDKVPLFSSKRKKNPSTLASTLDP